MSDTVILPMEVPLRAEPLSVWYRFGIRDTRTNRAGEPVADRRVLKDFCLHFQVKGESWIWCDVLGGSIAVRPGDVLFIPPGFPHAWAYVGETHLAVHFDLQRNAALTPHNYDNSYDMIEYLGGDVRENPVNRMPVFELQFPGQDSGEGWRIPLVSHPPNPAEWRRRLQDLVRCWETRTLETVLTQLSTVRTLCWALETLTLRAGCAQPVVDIRLARLLERLRDPAVLAEVAAMPVGKLANMFEMGETQFRKIFKGMTARTPHRYFRECQIREASNLLRDTTYKAKQIAKMIGIDDPYHFSRIFTDITGSSPSRYRREMRKRTGPPRLTTVSRRRRAAVKK